MNRYEAVNHPDHYKDKNGKECIDYMKEKWGPLCVLIFCVLNTYKYRFRKGKKPMNSDAQEMKKANWYKLYAFSIYHKELNFIERFFARRVFNRFEKGWN